MKLYNTASCKKEKFEPSGDVVKMYACGITVSGDAHIGHAYQALIYDIIRKFLIKCGYKVVYARNYTDVDDKIIIKSNLLNVSPLDYAKQMIEKIDKEMKEFEVGEPDVWLKATESIDQIIDFISALIKKGHAYLALDGSVYFSVESFPAYGKLSHRAIDDMIDGVRIENDSNKKNPLDFALWKSAKDGEIFWDSPFGKGRPGWHIECSAMNKMAFGDCIDIHGGGRDLIFPHHENEIAQTEALTEKPFVKYWIHNGLIKVNGQKMSKSLNNFILLRDLLDKYSPDVIKFALLSTSYRNDINITDNLFSDAKKHINEFYRVMCDVESRFGKNGEFLEIENDFNNALSDDFNTALALSNLFMYFKKIKKLLQNNDKTAGEMVAQIKKTYSILGLFKAEPSEYLKKIDENKIEIDEDILKMANALKERRALKDWAAADAIRAEIQSLGYQVKLTKDDVLIEAIEKD